MMHRISRLAAGAVLLLGAGAILSSRSEARWAHLTEPVPIERLVKNVVAYMREHPNEARPHYILGRLYSMAFAADSGTVEVIPPGSDRPGAEPQLPGFAGYQSIRVPRTGGNKRLSPKAVEYHRSSISYYLHASAEEPKNALTLLGLGWMMEEGARFAADLGEPQTTEVTRMLTDAEIKRLWQDRALGAYRRAYALAVSADLKRTGLGPAEDSAISLEAGEGILRVFAGRRTLSPREKAEAQRIRSTVQELKRKPRAITPIVFPLRGREPDSAGTASLSDLLAPERTVVFDLAGDGRAARWPWVGPDTGILVWDPEGRGRITSGRQLFGSATWWIFWKDGYAPLAALDDDRDGQLTGKELAGLAVWRDGNGNGVSEAGEVVPAPAAGIAALAVRAAGKSEGVPANPRGIRWSDGAFSPTYDWTPTSR